VEEDGVAEARATADTPCRALEALDEGVEPFEAGVGDGCGDGVEDAFQLALNHAGDALHRYEAGADRPGVLGLKDPPGGLAVRLLPHLYGQFLEHPGARGLQRFADELVETRGPLSFLVPHRKLAVARHPLQGGLFSEI